MRALLLVPVLLFAAACASTTPRMRVANDLDCKAELTKTEKIDEPPVPAGRPRVARWQVTGCGRTAVYLCTMPVRDCWREGEIQSVR
jgi:hypothetical protein